MQFQPMKKPLNWLQMLASYKEAYDDFLIRHGIKK